ncbi:glucokinase regulatory protein [Megalops cyprinoides]|uniref:glucokinase regulatory protein n=1 Tax=Megalops cyprinoides TaxID=118141 RepID=UPI0018650C09|nr:glucokinase regulatory protein [Megalops cyprinoides]
MFAAQKPTSETEETGRWAVPDYEPSLPVTEKSNPLTRDIDRAAPAQMVRLLESCDTEIFQERWEGVTDYQGLLSDAVVGKLCHVAKKVEDILKAPEDSLIVMSGCGTSGRLAFLLATSFNRLLKEKQQKQIYSYIIAGGDKALLTSQEAPEDSPHLGAQMLEKVCAGKKQVLFIGISCGLSAPFVSGQLDYCMNNLNMFTPVLIGFNPVCMARNEPIPGWPLTFRDVAERMAVLQETHRAFIINPIVGPEAISGSSRMKGGSATKILLETALWTGYRAAFSHQPITAREVVGLMRVHETVHKITYSQSEGIAFLVERAGVSLQRGGHVYYVGWHSLGVIGIIDASECIPTFGAEPDDICGFINDGYSEMSNKEGDLSSLGPEFHISHKDFVSTVLPNVTQSDTVIFVFTLEDDLDAAGTLAAQVKEKTSDVHAVAHAFGSCTSLQNNEKIKDVFGTVLNVTWPCPEQDGSYFVKLQAELSTKWILNAISTGAHILKGKIYLNYMMDLKVTNSKLFRRAIHMLQAFTGRSAEQCHQALLQAIYNSEDPTDETRKAGISMHTERASSRDKVVPTALVILTQNCTLLEARAQLDAHTVIRDAAEACLRRTPDHITAI